MSGGRTIRNAFITLTSAAGNGTMSATLQKRAAASTKMVGAIVTQKNSAITALGLQSRDPLVPRRA
jgi:hypothetical protein